jgi:hypothetical protein
VRVTCHARCGNHKFIKRTSSVGDITTQTGYHVTFSVGDIVFYCHECYTKAQSLAYGLFMVLRDKNVRLEDFFPKAAPKPDTIEVTDYETRPNETPPRYLRVLQSRGNVYA